jgi:hypothetical protein
VILVQFEGDVLCGQKPTAEVCTNPMGALTSLAERVAARVDAAPTFAHARKAAAPCRELHGAARLESALSNDGMNRYVALLNTLGGSPGRYRLSDLVGVMSSREIDAFAAFWNRASDADVQRIAAHLNASDGGRLKGRWWEP